MANSQKLEGIRCPECSNEQGFAVQMTMNIVMVDDGIDWGTHEPDLDNFPGRVIDPDDGFLDEDPIQCWPRRGGCGHLGTVGDFRVREMVSA